MFQVKKIFLTFFLAIFFINSSFVFAIEMTLDEAISNFNGNVGENFYKKIDEGIGIVEEEFYKQEFRLNKEDGTISEILNDIAIDNGLAPCFTKEASFSEIQRFVRVSSFNAGMIKDFLDEKCYTVLDVGILEGYKNVILEAYDKMHQRAQTKVKRINQLIKAGIYSDGNKKNSSFDIISDLQDINSILFKSDIKYYGTFKEDLGDIDIFIKETLKGKSPKEALEEAKKGENNIGDIKITDPVSNLRPTPIVDGNTSVCPPEENTSGLNEDTLAKLEESLDGQESTTNQNQENGNLENQKNNDEVNREKTNYKGKTDDNIWPCWNESKNDDSFNFQAAFCIKTEARKYTYNLLDYGEVRTIQGILERSNEHLKKFTHVSLVPNKMGVNNFEIGTIDLNLPDLFHTNIIIRTEPVPILNLKKANPNKQEDDFSLKNLLAKHFEVANLDVDRENDIQIFLGRDHELQNVNMSKNDKILKIAENLDKWNKIKVEQNKFENKLFDRQMNMKINSKELSEFYSLFSELGTFTVRFKEYSQDLNNIVKQMNKIPSI